MLLNSQLEQVLAGEIKYIEESQPDFVKIMTDGFFPYTSESFLAAKTSEDLKQLQPLPKDDKWFTYQVAYAKKLTDKYGDKIATFYNPFCPGTIIKFMQPNLEDGEPYLASLVRQDKEAVKAAFDVISDDLAELARRVITEAHVTGAYFSLQNLLGEGITREIYDEVLLQQRKRFWQLPTVSAITIFFISAVMLVIEMICPGMRIMRLRPLTGLL